MWKVLLSYNKLAEFEALFRRGKEDLVCDREKLGKVFAFECARSDKLKEIRSLIRSKLPSDSLYRQEIKHSAAFIAMLGGIIEIFNNSIDAGATEILILLWDHHSIDSNKVEISILDNGEGVRSDLIGEYDYRTALCRDSHKTKDKFGGRNLALAAMAKLLNEYEGSLILNNRLIGTGASITLTSNRSRCSSNYKDTLHSIPIRRHKSCISTLEEEDTLLELPSMCGFHRMRRFSKHSRNLVASVASISCTVTDSVAEDSCTGSSPQFRSP